VTREVRGVSVSGRGVPTVKGWFRPRNHLRGRTPRDHLSCHPQPWSTDEDGLRSVA